MRKVTLDDGTVMFEVLEELMTEAEFDRRFLADPTPSLPGACFTGWKRPILSDALGVHSSQRVAAAERNRRRGCNVDYTEDGRAILHDRAARRKLMHIEGSRDNQGGYGDGGGKAEFVNSGDD